MPTPNFFCEGEKGGKREEGETVERRPRVSRKAELAYSWTRFRRELEWARTVLPFAPFPFSSFCTHFPSLPFPLHLSLASMRRKRSVALQGWIGTAILRGFAVPSRQPPGQLPNRQRSPRFPFLPKSSHLTKLANRYERIYLRIPPCLPATGRAADSVGNRINRYKGIRPNDRAKRVFRQVRQECHFRIGRYNRRKFLKKYPDTTRH